VAVGVELEAVAFGIVADGVGHGRRFNPHGARRQGASAERLILLQRTRGIDCRKPRLNYSMSVQMLGFSVQDAFTSFFR
jgi:hypothetical protein